MYIRVLFRKGQPFSAMVSKESESFAENVADYAETGTARGNLPSGRATVSKIISYEPLTATDSPFSIVGCTTISEQVSFVDVSIDLTLMVVRTRQHGKALEGLTASISGAGQFTPITVGRSRPEAEVASVWFLALGLLHTPQ